MKFILKILRFSVLHMEHLTNHTKPRGLGVTRSHNRPSTSNDNPFSESHVPPPVSSHSIRRVEANHMESRQHVIEFGA